MTDKTLTIAVLGAGNIGGAVARGLVGGACRVRIYNRSAARLEAFKADSSYEMLTTDLTEATEGADIVIICVEGHAVEPLIKAMGGSLQSSRPVVVSCAAAPTLAQLGEWLTPYIAEPRIVRVLPNIAATCGESVNLVASCGCDEATETLIFALFSGTGVSYSVEEKLFPAAMAISSCGIANVLRYVRAATEAGVELGLSPSLACKLAAGSLAGTAAILDATGSHPEALVDAVTTPGGLTIRGLNTMEANGFSAAVIAGIKAAATR